MTDIDKKFTGSIPDVYDEYLVPLIFDSYAADMAAKAASSSPKDVLETAAGSGVVTRALAPLLASDARYAVTDLNPPMLTRAQSQQPTDHRIQWQQADAMELPFDDASFDVVCCQFGIMFLPDKAAGFKEALRVLRPNGRFIFNVWDHIQENVFAQSVTATAARFFPDNPPVFMARTPHGYHDINAINQELKSAGFGNIDVETLTRESKANSAFGPAMAYCQGTPLRSELEERNPDCLTEITKAAAADIAKKFGDGPVSGKIQGHVFVASR